MDGEFLNGAEGVLLLRIARDSLSDWVRSGERAALERYELTPPLREQHGAFVTLRRGGELRGCIGYTRSKVSLSEAVRDNAINAGTRDPRFPPVQADELPDLRIEVSALCPGDTPGSPFRRVEDVDSLALGADGLYLELGDTGRGGLLLPQVPGGTEAGVDVLDDVNGQSHGSRLVHDCTFDTLPNPPGRIG